MSGVTNPITLEEAKDHLRVKHDDENGVIASLLQASVDHFVGPRNLLGIDAESLTEIPSGLRAAILLKLEILYDKEIAEHAMLESAIEALENPYREKWFI